MSKGTNLAPSPFSSLLSSNVPPSEHDLLYLHSFVEERRQQISALDTEILGMESAYKALCAQQAELRDAVRAHESILHPMRRLPRHVLQEIFVLCRPTHRYPAMDKREAPLLLTRVCRFWRDLAQRTPRLWDCVHVPIPHIISEDVLLFQLDVAARWLDRAEKRPLSISIWSSMPTPPSGEVEKALQNTLLDRVSQIRHLQVQVHEGFFKHIANFLPPESWVLLEKVVVKRIWDLASESIAVDELSRDLQIWKAPKLKAVVWEGVDGQLTHLPLHWDSMEEISVSELPEGHRDYGPSSSLRCTLSLQTVRDLLQVCPKLRYLKIALNNRRETGREDGAFGGPWLVSNSPLALLHLAKLDLHDAYFDLTIPQTLLLHNLRLPALTSLCYKLGGAHGPPPPPEYHPLMRFIHAQNYPNLIQNFKIHDLSITRAGLLEFLKMTPSLQRLWVWHESRGMLFPSDDPDSGAAVNEEFLQALVHLCPRLDTLRVDRAYVGAEGVKDFVASRLSSATSGVAYGAHVSRIRRLSMGLVWDEPEGDEDEEGAYRVGNSFEEDLLDLGVEAHITTFSRSSPSLFSELDLEYSPRDDMSTIDGGHLEWD